MIKSFCKMFVSISLLLLVTLSSSYGSDLSLGDLNVSGNTLGLIGFSVLEYFLGRTKLINSNSTIELGFNILKAIFFKKKLNKTWRF